MHHVRLGTCALILLALLLSPIGAQAADETREVKFVHSVAIDATGDIRVVSWRGDLWRVRTENGNRLERLTWHPAMEREPRISPDGTTLAFISDRTGSRQVFTMPISGGQPTQISTLTEGFSLHEWTADGKALLVRTRLDGFWRDADRLYLRPIDPERPLELLVEAYADVGSLSPDGRYLAYTREGGPWFRKGHRGPAVSQIWVYDRESGAHTRLSLEGIEERMPRWSRDGKRLWFVSEEDGTYNLFSMLADGTDRTQHSTLEGDGILRYDIGGSPLRCLARTGAELYEIDPESGAMTRLQLTHVGPEITPGTVRRSQTRADAVAFTDDAREIAFIAGGDVWVMDTELREPIQVTDTPWHESSPVFSPDHGTLYFVTEFDGQVDVAAVTRGDPEAWWWQNDTFPTARFTDTPDVEDDLRISPTGEHISWTAGRGDVWLSRLDGADARKVLESWNAPSYDISPDGRWIAYAVDDDDFNRDVWIKRIDSEEAPFNLSLHPDYDNEPRWSPDGKILAFTGRRYDDEIDIHYVYLRRKDDQEGKRDRTLEKALEKMAKRKKKSKAPAGAKPGKDEPAKDQPKGKDDAKKDTTPPLAGVWNGTLKGDAPLPPEGMGFRVEVSRQKDGSYTISLQIPGQLDLADVPFTFNAEDGSFSFEAKTPLGPMTASGTLKDKVLEGTWQIEGRMSGTFRLEREEARLEKEETEPGDKPASEDDSKDGKKAPKKDKKKEPKPVEIDFDGIEDRIRTIKIGDSSESGLIWSPDGATLAFSASPNGSRGLYKVKFPDDLSPKKVTGSVGSHARWLASTKQIAWLQAGVPATMTATGKSSRYAFRCYQERSLVEEHEAIFHAAWRTMRDHWYDPAYGGNDWDEVRKTYAAYARHAKTRYELWTVANLMLGELNGSHLGFSIGGLSYSPSGWQQVSAHMGVRLDPIVGDEGLRVREVIPGGPADKERSKLDVGDVILSIDGDPIDGSIHVARMLTRRPGYEVDLVVRNAEGEEREVRLRPVSYGQIRSLLYEQWLETCRSTVETASKGQLGYLHIRGMNWRSFQRFENELYKVGHGKDGLIIDVRDNGGGFTADHLLTCLTQPVHAYTVPRGGGVGYPQGRMVYARWHKPIVVLCNQNSFSNAEIFSHAIKTLGRGRVVGVQTAGGVISTGRASLLGGMASVRVPFRGWFLVGNGQDMEHNGCVPDIVVHLSPGDRSAGRDGQLDQAVKALLEDVATWKANPLPKPVRATDRR